jgi:two-component sensor histidine kinase
MVGSRGCEPDAPPERDVESSLHPAISAPVTFAAVLSAQPGRWLRPLRALSPLQRGSLDKPADASGESGDGVGVLEFRVATLRVGCLLGWVSVAVVLVGLLSGGAPKQRDLLVALTSAAALANAVWMRIPWRDWLSRRRGQALLDVWSAGLLTYVGALVVLGGGSFAPLFFLAAPFVVVVQHGRRRIVWLLATAGTCVAVSVIGREPLAMGVMRSALVMAIVGAAVTLERAVRREAAARAEASSRAELERARFIDADHRVKNSLQTVADLLLLERPEGESAEVFEQSASRVRSIAAVHRLLSETGEARVRVDELLQLIVASDAQGIALSADPLLLDATAAQRVGLVANELITNARKHGELPISVRLEQDDRVTRLSVEDAGGSRPDHFEGGLGLDLVRRLVEQGLGGKLVLGALPRGGVRAEATF